MIPKSISQEEEEEEGVDEEAHHLPELNELSVFLKELPHKQNSPATKTTHRKHRTSSSVLEPDADESINIRYFCFVLNLNESVRKFKVDTFCPNKSKRLSTG